MTAVLHPIPSSPTPGLDGRAVVSSAGALRCFHCGTACSDRTHRHEDHTFCCHGCLAVYELLQDNGLAEYYALNATPGRPVAPGVEEDRYGFLDEPAVRDRVLDFSSERLGRVTWQVPAIHCTSCVWLLENLFRLLPGVGTSTVDLVRRTVSIAFDPRQLPLSRVASRLDALGYAPELRLVDLDSPRRSKVSRRLWLQVGVAGFAFGNTMLFSLAGYFGLDSWSGPAFRQLFGIVSLLLSLPVVTFSALDYWRAAWRGLRQRRLNLEVPIAAGIAALWLQSVVAVLRGTGEPYFDSLAGLLFFLLCGRVFQQKTFDRLTFDRDYRDFFPLSVCRLTPPAAGTLVATREERVALAQLAVGDRLRIRHGEWIPADARLVQGSAWMDYSFVTGEADPVPNQPGETLYAGGRQMGGAIEVTTLKPVSQSYLTSLWNQEVFRKTKDREFETITNRYSVRFTWMIVAIAVGAAAFWAWRQPDRAVRSFVGVLIVACPCALALAAPFALGMAVRVLGRRGVFLRNPAVIEALARLDTVVFDKTGTLTSPQASEVSYLGKPLSPEAIGVIQSLATPSTHPLAVRIGNWLKESAALPSGASVRVLSFEEQAGKGLTGVVDGVRWHLGSTAWLQSLGMKLPKEATLASCVALARDGVYQGRFEFHHHLRSEAEELIRSLGTQYRLSLLSGDHAGEASRFEGMFGGSDALRFGQSPLAKLEYVEDLQKQGHRVMMVGDGLNDAGALRQSDVGVAVVDQVGAFSPASDVILEGSRLPLLRSVLEFSHRVVGVVKMSFVVSGLYNLVGLAFAATGELSPVVCAILMPLSSISVVLFAVGAVNWSARRMAPVTERSPL